MLRIILIINFGGFQKFKLINVCFRIHNYMIRTYKILKIYHCSKLYNYASKIFTLFHQLFVIALTITVI